MLRKLGREGTRGATSNYRKMSVSLKSGQKLVPRFFSVPPISAEKFFINLPPLADLSRKLNTRRAVWRSRWSRPRSFFRYRLGLTEADKVSKNSPRPNPGEQQTQKLRRDRRMHIKEAAGIHVLLTRSLFACGILRNFLARVALRKSTSAPVRF